MRNRWSFKETGMVLDRALELRRMEPELAAKDSLYRGQDVIPEARRKKHLTGYLQKELLARLQTLEQKHRSDAGRIPKPTPEQLAPPAPPPAVPTLADQINTALPLLGGALVKLVVQALAPAIAQAAVEAVRHLQPTVKTNGNGAGHIHSLDTVRLSDNGASSELPERLESKLPEKFVRHKIAILQLLGPQQQEIAGRFPHLDIRWLSNDQAEKHIAQVSKNCEATFVMTKFTAHKAQKALSRENRHYCNGGISDLTRMLEQKFPRSTSMEAVTH